MVRLIDSDVLRLMKVEECAGHSIEYAMGWKVCIEWIKDQPTIPAIPLDWLREKMRGYASALRSTEMDAVVRVMKMWEEEQEG